MNKYLDYIVGGGVVGVIVLSLAAYKHNSNSSKDNLTTATADATTASTDAATTATLSSSDVVSKKHVHSVDLDSSNTIAIVGEIGAESLDIAQAINEKAKGGQPIFLLINSPGGSVLDGVAIVSAMQASKVPVYTICLQLCASMAAIIFETGTKRLMVDRSIVMFHEAAGGVQGSFNQIKSRLHVFDRLTAKLDFEIAKRVGIDPEVFKSKLGDELWLDAEDAVAQHYADGLVNINMGLVSSPGGMQQNSQTKALSEKVNINF